MFQGDRAAAAKYASVASALLDSKVDASQAAAYMAVASVILNLDVTVTKE